MSRARIPNELRQRVSEQARHRCGYCLTVESVVGTPMELDHIVLEALGGQTAEDNLWLACSLCNDIKGDRIAAVDPVGGEVVRLFDPRRQVWAEHFRWTPEGDRIVGTTPCGRATVVGLNLNRQVFVRARRAWVTVGWHPPKDRGEPTQLDRLAMGAAAAAAEKFEKSRRPWAASRPWQRCERSKAD